MICALPDLCSDSYLTLPTEPWQTTTSLRFFFQAFISFFVDFPLAGGLVIASIVIPWGVAMGRRRKIIWGGHRGIFPTGRIW